MLRAGVRTIWSLRTRNQQFSRTKSSDSSSTPLLVYWLLLGHENSRIRAKMEGPLVISPKKECLTGFANIEQRGRHFEIDWSYKKRPFTRVACCSREPYSLYAGTMAPISIDVDQPPLLTNQIHITPPLRSFP